jgi:KaiC/GvpD/RAD55 family RecA-like ATPase
MRENYVLSACISDRHAFTLVADHVEHEDFSEQGWIVWNGICEYYDKDSGTPRVDTGILTSNITRRVLADKHKEMFTNLVAGLEDLDVSGANVVDDLLSTKRDVVGKQLAAALLSGQEDAALLDKYNNLLDANGFDEEEEEDARIGMSVMELVGTGFDAANLIEIAPPPLNDRLDGGVKPGHHLLLFARPEMGKTMMTIEMMAGFASQGLKTLYIGNEDPLDDINMRVVNRLSGMTKLEVINNPEKADGLAREKGYENIILKAATPGTTREITALLEKFTPHVLVLDQLRNLDMKQDNYVLALENAAKQARQWAKRYSCVVVSVTQAGDSAAGKAVLDMGDVDFSNTGIPSQCDVMIGMGATHNHQMNGEVVISLSKNKVSGRHEYFAVSVEPHLSKILPI